MEITVKVTGLEGLIEALNNIKCFKQAATLTENSAEKNIVIGQNTAPQPQDAFMAQQPALQTIMPGLPTTATNQVSTPQPPQIPNIGVPTTVQSYTLEQLANAATPIMDAGGVEKLTALLNSFGVQALTELPQERYGAFAMGLRQLGAQI